MKSKHSPGIVSDGETLWGPCVPWRNDGKLLLLFSIFGKICRCLGIHRLIVLYIAEITARNVQAMHIWVSFIYIKHTHLMYLISDSTELWWCGRPGEASWKQLQRIAKLTYKWRIPIQEQTCSCSEIGLELIIVMRRLISTMQYIVQLSYRVWMRYKNLYTTVLVNDQLDAQFFYLICLFQSCTCFEQPRAHHQENQLYQYSFCYSKHVEDWNKHIRKENCASSWSFTRIIPRCTVNRT
jgi:hypothetical protein